jgi:hypothetical protein
VKTIKQIADELGVSKTAVRNYLTDEVQTKFAEIVSGTIYINEEGVNLIKSRFNKSEPKTKFAGNSANQFAEVTALVSMLQKELDIKNSQIAELNKSLSDTTEALRLSNESLHAAQVLHAGTFQQQLIDAASSEETKKPGFFDFLRRK